MTAEQIDKLPISLDTALEALGIIQAHRTEVEYGKLEKEKKMLLGIAECTWEERMAMFNKVCYVYCPMIKDGSYQRICFTNI
jgi:hypothetical protein